MKPTLIRIAVSKTVNLGNFNSIRVECDLTAAVEEGETLSSAKADLQEEVRTALAESFDAHRRGFE